MRRRFDHVTHVRPFGDIADCSRRPVPPAPAQSTYAGVISGQSAVLTFTNTGDNPGGPNSAGVINGYSAGVINGISSSGGGTVVLSGSNTYTGTTTTFGGGVLQTWSNDATGTFDLSGVAAPFGAGVSVAPTPSTPVTPIPAGPVFYVIIEGAGLGDSVRTMPCTGKETVLSAVGAVNGIAQVSGTKMWIARPTPKSDKSTILAIDWEAISKRGINTTNYTLMPGDRLVFAADPLVTRSNLLGKKVATIERVEGIVSLTAATISGLQSTPGAGQLVKELVQKGLISDDEELKKIVLDLVRCAEQHKKADRKATEEPKPGRGEEESSAAGTKAAEVQGSFRLEIKPNASGSKASAEPKEAAPTS